MGRGCETCGLSDRVVSGSCDSRARGTARELRTTEWTRASDTLSGVSDSSQFCNREETFVFFRECNLRTLVNQILQPFWGCDDGSLLMWSSF